MKKLMILVLALSLFVMAAGVEAVSENIRNVTLNSPTNVSYDNDGVVNFTFNVSGNHSADYSCSLYEDFDGSFGVSSNQINTNVSNNTITTFRVTGISDDNYTWNIGCTKPGNLTLVYSPSNFSLIVDSVDPNISINSPLINSWYTNGSLIMFNITVLDVHADACILETNLNGTDATIGLFNTSTEIRSYTNNTALNFSFGYNSSDWPDNNTGGIHWNVLCNDSAGNSVRFSENKTFWIDSLKPNSTNLTHILVGSSSTFWDSVGNNSISTDYTPRINWTATIELNFSRYELKIYNSTSDIAGNLVYAINLTNRTNTSHIVQTNLQANVVHYINVTAYDLAGNSNSTNSKYVYQTDSTCRNLSVGWNICGLIRTKFLNATTLCTETGADFISQYNKSHLFQTHTCGATANQNLSFSTNMTSKALPSTNSTVLIYVGTAQTWESRVWEINAHSLYFNLTNISNGWNLVPMVNRTNHNFSAIDRSLNGDGSSVTYLNVSHWMSYRNNSASTNYPMVRNWSINENMSIPFGDAIWVHLNISVKNFIWNSSGEI